MILLLQRARQLLTGFSIERVLPQELIIHDWVETISALCSSEKEEEEEDHREEESDLSKWIGQQLHKILQEAPSLYVEDGPTLANLMHPRMIPSVLSVLKRVPHNTPALISFLVSMDQHEILKEEK